MSKKTYLVTGGTGFIGAALVKALLKKGYSVRILDNDSRGSIGRLEKLKGDFEFILGDMRDPAAVDAAVSGVDSIFHLAFVNGTKFFYAQPELVLDVGVRGMLHILDSCKKHGVRELFLASSSEVYQTAPKIPTDESAPLSIPDPLNPRYSYGAGKIISEMLALHCEKNLLDRMVIFRPHNVYGPEMGWEHVIPEFIVRMLQLSKIKKGKFPFPIQGTGEETRSFVFISDFIQGVMKLVEKGQNRSIYHVGTEEEVSMSDLARSIAKCLGLEIDIVPGALPKGGTKRRCPDISKISSLGYRPQFALEQALPEVVQWYSDHISAAPASLS
jgi:nucleoside-diphosphate-sugar epimerase